MTRETRKRLLAGAAIPALPLALNARRKWDERRQRALIRYYLAAGAGGLAAGVHTTQFAIRSPKIGLFAPLLQLAREELDRAAGKSPHIRVAGICGATRQAVREAGLAAELGFHAGLLSLSALPRASVPELIEHCREVGKILPLFGFYLQPAAGGRPLSFEFWREIAELGSLVAIKIAPFNRYQTLDVIRAVAASGRRDIALYTGNDDNILVDLLTPFPSGPPANGTPLRIVGGLLGHWAVWTRQAVSDFADCRELARRSAPVPARMLRRHAEVTDANAAFFDAANGFAGCIPGIHEVLRRQGLLEGVWCLDPSETLSPGQRREIDRVYRSYPHLNDDTFVAAHRDEWLRG